MKTIHKNTTKQSKSSQLMNKIAKTIWKTGKIPDAQIIISSRGVFVLFVFCCQQVLVIVASKFPDFCFVFKYVFLQFSVNNFCFYIVFFKCFPQLLLCHCFSVEVTVDGLTCVNSCLFKCVRLIHLFSSFVHL